MRAAVLDSRMPWWALTDMELAAYLSTPLEVAPRRCLAVRNLLIYLWFQCRARGKLSLSDAMQKVAVAGLERIWCSRLLPDVYQLLQCAGLINFRAGRFLSFRLPLAPDGRGPLDGRSTVIVVGAGIAGLTAAHQLRELGHRAIVLEAQRRIGGRVLTEVVDGNPIDLGAMILVGTVGNPLTVVAEQLGCKLHKLDRSRCPLFGENQEEVHPELDARASKIYDSILDESDQMRPVRRGKRAKIGLSDGGRWEPEELRQAGVLAQTNGNPPANIEDDAACPNPTTVDSQREEAGDENRTTTDESATSPCGSLFLKSDCNSPSKRLTTWLSCDKCGRWRRLGMVRAEDLPERWVCDDNPDPRFASCRVPQELPDEEIDRRLGISEAVPERSPRPQAKDVPCRGKSLGSTLQRILEKTHMTNEELRVIHWHLAHLEYACAAPLDKVSHTWWDQDDEHTIEGDHVVLCDGFGKIIEGIAAYSEIQLQREVFRIEHDIKGVRVFTKGCSTPLEGDAVLVTIPLGVLKARSIKFQPPLPPWKKEAIDRLGFGPIEKIVLFFKQRFWPEDVDYFGCLVPRDLQRDQMGSRRGDAFMFWNLQRSHNVDALMCISSGIYAEKSGTLSFKVVVRNALSALERTFGNVVQTSFRRPVVSDWGRNPFCRGSYSYVGIDSSGKDYDELARPIGARLFFAGEATNGQHPATATGAFLSGLREAQRIDLCARRKFPMHD